jgi:hypothetical protein
VIPASHGQFNDGGGTPIAWVVVLADLHWFQKNSQNFPRMTAEMRLVIISSVKVNNHVIRVTATLINTPPLIVHTHTMLPWRSWVNARLVAR